MNPKIDIPIFFLSLVIFLCSCSQKQMPTENLGSEILENSADSVSYDKHVKPILSTNCFFCHGPDESNNKAGLRLDNAEDAYAALKDSKEYAIVPGDAKKSLVVEAIFSDDPAHMMPPPESHRTLTLNEKETIKQWIEQGAVYEKHWAFHILPDEVKLPGNDKESWANQPVDYFILERLKKEGLPPSPEASPQRWLRRVTFDLTGLPPTQQEIDEYISDTSQKGKEKVVERLLASQSFGERMATPWLDVARYADSFGYQADTDTKAWPYRDWVIRSLNENLPYDEFIIEQIAGDLLTKPTVNQRLATAFNRIHRKTNEGGSVPEEFRQDGISDRVHAVGTAFMGLTMECARCHDHKYDPITAKDYYSLGAFFNSIDEFGLIQGGVKRGIVTPQPALQLPTDKQKQKLTLLENKITEAEQKLENYLNTASINLKKLTRDEYVSPEMIAKYTFSDKQGKGLNNELTSENKGTSGGNTFVEGKRGNALLADGDSLTKLPHYGIQHADQPFSVSLWVHPAKEHERAVIFANSPSYAVPYSGYELLIEEGRVTWSLARELPGCGASVSSKQKIPGGQWTHISVTNDGSQEANGLNIYINGELAEVDIKNDNLTRDFIIGKNLLLTARGRDVGLKNGMVDELIIHKRAISQLEVLALMDDCEVADVQATGNQFREYYLSAIDDQARELRSRLAKLRAQYRTAEKDVREIVTMRESAKPAPAYILDRGDYTSPTVKVERETPSWLPPFPEDQPRNRLGFARWLTSDNHPLTSRVTVNRLWQELFGRGIVATSDNFGLQGDHPSHPKLLDWLARDFINSGWDFKRAIRQIVLSATYAQDSKATEELRNRDPDNTLLARGPLKRLTAEQLRDSTLAHSGLLLDTVGGPPVHPYQAPGSMWKELNNFLPVYKEDKGKGLYRRSLYTFWRRTTTPPNMMIFDSAARDVCATRRQTTNTPLQPLVMLNDPQYVEAARKLGERILKYGGKTDLERARWTYREVIGKAPTSRQVEIIASLIKEQRETFQSGSSNAESLLKVGTSKADSSLDPIELATATTLAQSILNLDANITLR